MSKERAEKDKFTHEAVRYEHPAAGPDHCSMCAHYINANPVRCTGVKSPIRPQDWCVRFDPKRA